MNSNHMMIDLVDVADIDDHQEDNFANGGVDGDCGNYEALGGGDSSSTSLSKGSFSGENLSDASKHLFGTDDEFEDDDGSEDSDDEDDDRRKDMGWINIILLVVLLVIVALAVVLGMTKAFIDNPPSAFAAGSNF